MTLSVSRLYAVQLLDDADVELDPVITTTPPATEASKKREKEKKRRENKDQRFIRTTSPLCSTLLGPLRMGVSCLRHHLVGARLMMIVC